MLQLRSGAPSREVSCDSRAWNARECTEKGPHFELSEVTGLSK